MNQLQVVRLGHADRLQYDCRYDKVGALRYPPLGRPVERGPLCPRLLELLVLGGIQVHLWELECDSFGSSVKASVWSGNSANEMNIGV